MKKYLERYREEIIVLIAFSLMIFLFSTVSNPNKSIAPFMMFCYYLARYSRIKKDARNLMIIFSRLNVKQKREVIDDRFKLWGEWVRVKKESQFIDYRWYDVFLLWFINKRIIETSKKPIVSETNHKIYALLKSYIEIQSFYK